MTSQRWRTALASLAVGVAVPLAAAGTPADAAPAHTEAQATASAVAAKADKKVIGQISTKGKATFWVYLNSKADLSGAGRLHRKADKAAFVYQTKTEHAKRTQAGLRGLLHQRGVEFTPFWLANTIKVTGDKKLLDDIAVRSEVAKIIADDPVDLPKPLPGETVPTTNGVEWNIDRINAPQVWNELGVRGEGIVVANIDTGVDYTHPAVAAAYRGRNADGTYDHNYNWYDPAGICPSAAPCDNNDHGTHTMGTMVGLDGANAIGVAPGAKWIAAKGCETNSCSLSSLLAAGQWVVAPTDLNGNNPRPDLAPDVVNNSWGGSGYDSFYEDTVASWVAAGIFPAFSNGNDGPSCDSSGSPGLYPASYSSGAFDVNNQIASFSSRGPGLNGDVKPNIAAPGVNVRSSIPGGYDSFSGTSMASPHTAAAVALMWSASPAIQGDIAATKQILDDTAVDVDATECGGTVDDNNVFGEGRLDAYAAVTATPRGALGALNGHVTSGGAALGGATVTVSGPLSRTTATADDGSYTFDRLMIGDYTITVSKFGYVTTSASVTIAENQTATRDVAVEQAPSATLSGTVTTSAGPANGATITVLGTPLSATADEQGHYSLTVPEGDYDVRAEHVYRCADVVTRHVTLAEDTTLDVQLPDRTDTFGYACAAADGQYVAGTDPVALTGDDKTTSVALPFRVPLYGKTYGNAWISTNGVVGFGTAATSYSNTELPNTSTPNLALYPFWDDLYVDADAGIYTATVGAKPHRTFVVEWRNITTYSDRGIRLTFTASIGEDGSITYRYQDIDGSGRETGTSATIGLENADGTDAFEYSYNVSTVRDGAAIAFRTTKTGVLAGVVTDANDGRPVAGATVTAQVGDQTLTDTTDAEGSYAFQAAPGTVQLTVAKEYYESASAAAEISVGGVASQSTALRTARVTVAVDGLDVIAPTDQTRSRQIGLSNTGGLGTDFTVTELNAGGTAEDIGWLSLSDATGTLASGARHTVGVAVDTAGLSPGTYHEAKLRIASASGRQPVIVVPVTLVVPSYVLAMDAGAQADRVDVEGQSWSPDRAYISGGAGYLGNSHDRSTDVAIGGTTDPARFADQREGMYEYRIDGLADGYYTIELDFAELRSQAPDKRIFDVLIEGEEVLPALDVAGEVGSFTALTKTFTVRVIDGQLNVRFVTHKGFGQPILNSLRVTDRPDLVS